MAEGAGEKRKYKKKRSWERGREKRKKRCWGGGVASPFSTLGALLIAVCYCVLLQTHFRWEVLAQYISRYFKRLHVAAPLFSFLCPDLFFSPHLSKISVQNSPVLRILLQAGLWCGNGTDDSGKEHWCGLWQDTAWLSCVLRRRGRALSVDSYFAVSRPRRC